MRKVAENKEHADECRAMAASMKNQTQKEQLQEMAEAWAMLARERRKQLAKQGNVANDDNHPLDSIRSEK